MALQPGYFGLSGVALAEDLLATFSLLRRVLIKMIEGGHVPSKDELELLLLGGGDI